MKGLIYCVRCGATISRDPSVTKHPTMTIQDQIDFTNAELRALVWRENNNLRGVLKDPEAIQMRRARKHLQRALQGVRQLDGSKRTFLSCVDRWDNDELYRSQLQKDENLTREHMREYDYLACLPRVEQKMSWKQRQKRNQQWRLVQEEGGGSRTVQTTSYPVYQSLKDAKAPSPTPYPTSSSSTSWNYHPSSSSTTWNYHPSSSSTSWSRGDQWWSQSRQDDTPPWRRDEEWGYKDW